MSPKLVSTIVLIFLMSLSLQAQKVALVCSGGGAKGLAHIGVIKALEENNIPIDYIVGTSMGGIIGGCYASGMTPAQMEEMVLSKNFFNWVNGRFETGQYDLFFRREDDASFIRINLSLDSTFTFMLNSNLAKDVSLNYAMAEIFTQPSATAKNNFDSLMIPLRVMAADIFTQTEVILYKGILSEALRATQTVPFFYSPIRINGKYLFDGGIYNNFPIDVAQSEFCPEVIIGSNVSSKINDTYPYGDDDKKLSRSLFYLLLDKSDPSLIPPNGVYIEPNLEGYTALDFGKAKVLIDSGYNETICQIAEIKSKIKARKTAQQIEEQRALFKSKFEPIAVENVIFKGFKKNQQQYLSHFFKNRKRPLNQNEIKQGYYKLVSEPYFENTYPSFSYNTIEKNYNFKLTKRPQNNFQVDFGGVISSRYIGDIFLGLNYYYFNKLLTRNTLNFFAGNFYKSMSFTTRTYFPFLGHLYVEPEIILNNWNYYVGTDILQPTYKPTFLNRYDRKYGVNIGVPLSNQYKLIVNGAAINNSDSYLNTEAFVSSDTLDQLDLKGGRLGMQILTQTLNRKQYPSQGKNFSFSFTWFRLDEFYTPGNTAHRQSYNYNRHNWLEAKLLMEQYYKVGIYSSGYYLQTTLSTQPLFTNYYGTIINAPSPYPIPETRTILLQRFRAFNYVTVGWRNVFEIKKKLNLRLEAYIFKPFESLLENENQQVKISDDFRKVHLMGTASLVLHSSLGPVSLSLNYYDDKNRPLNILLHIGFLLFNKSSME